MRKFVVACVMLLLMVACNGGAGQKGEATESVEVVDSAALEVDSICEAPDAEEIIPATADESFADFFYNFASDAEFQLKRILFPLSYYKETKVFRIQKDGWKYDPLFSKEGIYTLLFDKEEDMELEKDTSLHSVRVEWLYLKTKKMKRYYFERKQEAWFLEAMNLSDLPSSDEKDKEDFFDFFYRFANDSTFQRERLARPLYFVTADPEDEFQILETVLEEGQWFAFQPPMPKVRIANINYGQNENLDSSTKVMEFKGFGNGFSNTLYFERRKGIWKLVRFEDLSD